MKYRSEIDGLRSIAVLPVILFHAGFAIFSGGFVGVDVFFVISGYLITLMIISERKKDEFSILNFYERRIRRIIPALFTVILSCLPFVWFWMMPFEIRDFSQSIVAVVFFASNILFWQESNYFEPESDQKPLLHTWSLAVEEQFYVFFPLLILIFWRLGRNNLFLLISAISMLSLLISEWGSKAFPSANFYLAPGRAWELLFGSLTAMIVINNKPNKSNLLSALGLLMILFAIFIFDEDTPFPSFYTLIPVLGTCLIILFADNTTLVGRILSLRILVFLGLISYSAYLWHQPIFAFARIKSLGDPSILLMTCLSFLALFLAYLSWRFVEQPFRNKSLISSFKVYSLFFFFSLVIVLIGLLGHSSNGFYEYKSKLLSGPNQIFLFDRQIEYRERDNYWDGELRDSNEPFSKTDLIKVIILGDSIGKDFYVASNSSQEIKNHYQLRYAFLDDLCIDFISSQEKPPNDCKSSFDSLKTNKLIEAADQIVLAAHWQKNTWRNGLIASQRLKDFKKVKVMGSLKVAEISSIGLHAAQKNLSDFEMKKFSFQSIDEEVEYSYKLGEALKEIEGVNFYNKLEVFCEIDKEECSFFKKNGAPLIWDNMHITLEGIDNYASWIYNEVLTRPAPMTSK
jgi:peptidoglycan/LPS O-acetylase OafA/YrhL